MRSTRKERGMSSLNNETRGQLKVLWKAQQAVRSMLENGRIILP
jgi:hypothetical protein